MLELVAARKDVARGQSDAEFPGGVKKRDGIHAARHLDPGHGPAGKVVVARPEALDLVKYLQGLDHTYPVLPPPPRSAAGPAAGSAS